jgi:hypothetical protein
VIEVRIPLTEICEYTGPLYVETFFHPKLLSAGIPEKELGLDREGILVDYGTMFDQSCIIWRWYPKGEYPPTEYLH